MKNPPPVMQGGFDRVLAGLEVLSSEPGRVVARLLVDEPVQNMFGRLHGGAIATLVDDVGTLAIVSADGDRRPGVSVDLNVSYVGAGRPVEPVLIEAQVLKSGRSLAFVEVTLRHEGDGSLIARGRMTKLLGGPKG
jgi:acyl-coenzyme A thioesterase 13